MADEFPIAFRVFAAKIRGTKDEIFTKLLLKLHGFEQNTLTSWKQRLEDLKNPPTPAAAVTVAEALIPTPVTTDETNEG